ncbi:uncharacterized protein conserved in bacteria [Lentimicrobium saccharophilum]|uniref:Uncharacterized protein conserved in bacteria n=1 Tax=Lentimicrobium saccharophilum TaxID=1678841 RepID=A0A0S7C494_9BACT|nr:DUF2147 domain-containing protein [Lentimicrobium saccharophilum]GAP43747.1 uncharacterized protein conserved in bacteria [Lentimicrobium saccharophilum]
MKFKILTLALMFVTSATFAQTQPEKQSTKESETAKPSVVVKQMKPAGTAAKETKAQTTKEVAPKPAPQVTPANQKGVPQKQVQGKVAPADKKAAPQKQATKEVAPAGNPKSVAPQKATPANQKVAPQKQSSKETAPIKPKSVAPVKASDEKKSPVTTPKDITGYWLTANKASIIHFTKTGDVYNGKIVWLRQPNDKSGKPVRDVNNPNKAKRNNPVLGTQMVYNLKYNAAKKIYEGGKAYQPQTGRTFDCKAKVTGNGNVLEVTGIAGLSMISKTLTWSRTNGIPGKGSLK